MQDLCAAGLKTHSEGMLFFILHKYKQDRAKLFQNTKEQLDLLRDRSLDPASILPPPLWSQVSKAMSLKK